MSSWYGRWGKRWLDLLLASLALVLLAPLLVVLATATGITTGKPVFFRQRRAGRFGRPFDVLKFRSMRDTFDRDGRPLPDEDRLTGFGRFLRSSSFDELPSLLNIVRGDMSIVGPRPLLVSYVSRYTPLQRGRLAVRPGLTGLAQIEGRQELPFSKRIALDLDYIEELSLWGDLSIMLRTIPAVLSSRGVINGQLASQVDDLRPEGDPEEAEKHLSELRRRFT